MYEIDSLKAITYDNTEIAVYYKGK